MADKDIFRQQRQPINPGEFEGQDEGDISALRSQFQKSMTSEVPPGVQQMMPPDHPLNADNMSAEAMYENARRLMQQQGKKQQQAQPQQFNPDFNPQDERFKPQSRFSQFEDPNYRQVIDRLQGLTGKYVEIELPSRGRFYLHGEGPSNGILHIRPMTGHEEQILTSTRLVKQGKALNMVFKACIGEQIDPELLLAEDRNYILIYLRGISHSPYYDVEITCPGCSKTFPTKIELHALEVDYCPDDFGPSSLSDTLPASGIPFRYRLATGKDEILVQENREKRVKDWGGDVTDNSTLFRASLQVEDIGGVTHKMMIQQILERLPMGDISYIRELVNEPPFGVNTRVGLVCPMCAHEFEMETPMELGFFFPKRNSQKRKPQQA